MCLSLLFTLIEPSLDSARKVKIRFHMAQLYVALSDLLEARADTF